MNRMLLMAAVFAGPALLSTAGAAEGPYLLVAAQINSRPPLSATCHPQIALTTRKLGEKTLPSGSTAYR